jgi:hypothetical protein
MTRIPTLLCLATVAAALAGCFGGGGDDSPAPMPVDPLAAVPDAAIQSVAGTLDYLDTLSKNNSETREAIDVSAVVLPTSDTTEPQAVN